MSLRLGSAKVTYKKYEKEYFSEVSQKRIFFLYHFIGFALQLKKILFLDYILSMLHFVQALAFLKNFFH